MTLKVPSNLEDSVILSVLEFMWYYKSRGQGEQNLCESWPTCFCFITPSPPHRQHAHVSSLWRQRCPGAMQKPGPSAPKHSMSFNLCLPPSTHWAWLPPSGLVLIWNCMAEVVWARKGPCKFCGGSWGLILRSWSHHVLWSSRFLLARKEQNNQVAAERAESGQLVLIPWLHSRLESHIVINQI